jgi:hypothetical protein
LRPFLALLIIALSVLTSEATEIQLRLFSRWNGSLPQLQPLEKVLPPLQPIATYTPLEAELRGVPICTAFRLGRAS